MTGYAGLGQDMAICKSNIAATVGLRPAGSRIIIKDNAPPFAPAASCE